MPKYKKCPKHQFSYSGGQAKCKNCGKYLQPDGRITRLASGRDKPKKRK